MYFSFLLWASTSAAIQPGLTSSKCFMFYCYRCYCIIWTNKSLSLSLLCILRYAVTNECYVYESTKLSVDSCQNINGTYIAHTHACYYHVFACPYYNVSGQCHRNRLCDAFSCDTCRLYGGLYEPTTRWL